MAQIQNCLINILNSVLRTCYKLHQHDGRSYKPQAILVSKMMQTSYILSYLQISIGRSTIRRSSLTMAKKEIIILYIELSIALQTMQEINRPYHNILKIKNIMKYTKKKEGKQKERKQENTDRKQDEDIFMNEDIFRNIFLRNLHQFSTPFNLVSEYLPFPTQLSIPEIMLQEVTLLEHLLVDHMRHIGSANQPTFNLLLNKVSVDLYMLSSFMLYWIVGNVDGWIVTTIQFQRPTFFNLHVTQDYFYP